ncbi:hypothetical protein C8F04DRAFT_1109261 [Mycena alexandri]|uniref:BTB domain-containing protein n=1 Tax=Mycena alexandri TaxID=1745969 RepID=A0AAD6X4H0_9AGAR|nr:hypothetical protein C8F04DRAFT_1109261 [Mycena alexandri]
MTGNPSLRKAEALWFSPDVVILRADTHIFRVFAAILKAQSSVFADMFTFPQPPSADMESIDGFPVVEVHDKPEDVEVFLKAIFDSSFFMPPPAEVQFKHALGILRLAHKYDVPYLRRRALDHLGPIFPTHLFSYDDTAWLSSIDLDRRFATIRTATEVGALWLLPMAYYDLCRQTMEQLISNASWKDLEEKVQRACLIGHSAQRHHLHKIIGFLSIVKNSGGTCKDWTKCNALRLRWGLRPELWTHNGNPLGVWVEGTWRAFAGIGLCDSCVVESKALHAAAIQEFWDQLPQMFGLPGWEELEEMKRAALSVH